LLGEGNDTRTVPWSDYLLMRAGTAVKSQRSRPRGRQLKVRPLLNFQRTFRRVSIALAVLMVLNLPLVFWIAATHPGLSQPDDLHTYAITLRSGAQRFYTPVVGTYLFFSFIGAACAMTLLYISVRVRPRVRA